MKTTALYAAILALFFFGLAVRAIKLRRRNMVILGDGNVPDLQRAVRSHGNFAEYVPFGLILMALAEAGGFPAPGIHLLGGALVAGRALHAWGINQAKEDFRFRIAGMSLTFFTLIGGALSCLYVGLQ